MRLNRMAFHYTWPARDWYINRRADLLPLLRKRGLETETGGHFLSTFLPRNLIKTHPAWFRMNQKGERVNDYNLNPFSARARAMLTSNAEDFLVRMPEASLFHVWADDIEGGGWSHEPGKQRYTPSDQALLVYNNLIGRVRQKLPHAKLSFLAYHDTVFPPQVEKPAPGIAFFYAPRERCYAHALDDPGCALNQKYAEALEKALPMFNRADAEVFEYYTDEILFENMTDPPLPDVISRDAQYYHRLGIPAVGSLMTNTSNFQTPQTNLFLYPKALWNPSADLWKPLKEYATLYWGDPALIEYFRELNLGLKDVLKVCPYEHPGDAWDSMKFERESDGALEFRLRCLEQAATGPLAKANDSLNDAARRSQSVTYRERLAGEQNSMNFTLRQAKLFYHLLKGTLFSRRVKALHDPQAGVGLGVELVLARYQWAQQKAFVARGNLKGEPLVPGTEHLVRRWNELVTETSQISAEVMDIDPEEYAIDDLSEQLQKGVGGRIVSGAWGSVAVIWDDLSSTRRLEIRQAGKGTGVRGGDEEIARPYAARETGREGLSSFDEFGRPLRGRRLDLNSEPVVVKAQGMRPDELFDALDSRRRAD